MRFLRVMWWCFIAVTLGLVSSVRAQTNLTWTQTYPTVHNGYAFVLSPLNDNVVYIHDNVEHAFKVSYDAGATWSTRGSVFPGNGIRTIRVSPLDTSVIVMVGNSGILRSTDGGYNWDNVQPEGSIDGESIDYNFAHPDTMYFVDFYTSEFWLSADTGRTWQVRSVVPFGHVCTIAADPFHPNVIVVGAGDTKIARSTDYGLTWTLVKGGNLYFSECPKIVWDKSTPNMVYAAIQLDATYSFFRSTDGGVTWNDMGLYGVFMWGLDQDPVNGDLFIGAFASTNAFGQVAQDQGIYRSADKGKSWQQLGNVFHDPNVWMIKASSNHDIFALNADAANAFGNVNLYKLNTNPSGYGKVSGTITATGGATIQHASVVVVGGSDSCIVNNSEGTYTMYLLPGTYSLRAQTGGVEVTIGNVTVSAGVVTTQNFELPISQTTGSISVSHSNIYQDEIEATVQLWGRYSNGSPLLIETTTTSTHTFTNLSSLNTYDSIVVVPPPPYFRKSITAPSLDSNYSFEVDRSDVFLIVDISTSGSTYSPGIQGQLADSGFTSYVWDVGIRGRSLPIEAIEKTKRRTVMWFTYFGSIPTTFLDTLSMLCDRGVHLFASGPDLVELNSSHSLFQNKLGVGFNGNYTTSTSIKGFTGNVIGDGITTSIALNGATRDKLTLLNGNVHKAFYYGPNYDPDSVNVGGVNVDNTGHGARGVFISVQFYRLYANSNMGKILARSLMYFGNPPPAPPTALNASVHNVTNKEIRLSWTASGSGNVAGYLVYRGTESISDTTGKRVASLGNVNLYDDVVADYGTYYYKIYAVDNGGQISSASNQSSVTISVDAPDAPSNLTATAVSISKIQLSWTDNSNNETGFIVSRSLTSGSGHTNIDTVEANVATFTDSNLTANTKYYYFVKAVNASGSSPNSNEASDTTFAIPLDDLYAPRITTSILQNPALSKYFDIVMVTDTALSNVPTVKMWITGSTDSTAITMTLVNGTTKAYRGASVFSVSGTYNFLIKATAAGGRDSVQMRTYAVTLAKPGQIASLTTPDGRATLVINKRSVNAETYVTASEEKDAVVKFGPEKEYEEELALTMTYADGDFADEGKLFIYQKTGDIWTPLRTQVYAEKNQVRALVKNLGEFKIGFDATFTGNNVVPKEFALKQNYPNPFNPSTTIAFDLSQDGNLKLIVYNLLGQRVKTLYSGFQLAGSYRMNWDGKNELGQQVASGVYLYRVEAGAFVKTKKMMLIK